jgi:hypothetical protein
MLHRLLVTSLLAVTVLAGTAACSSPAPAQSPGGPRQAGPPSAPPSGQGSTPVASGPPGIIAVTTGGALVLLSSSTGAVTRTILRSGVETVAEGVPFIDEITVSPDGRTIYFTGYNGCTSQIESVPVSGGTPTVIAPGLLTAVSPGGSSVAFTRQGGNPGPGASCGRQDLYDGTAQYFSLVVRNLSTGGQAVYPMAPDDTGALPEPISYVSWAPGGGEIAVSVTSEEDNEGYDLVVLNPATAHYYSTGTGTTSVVPVPGGSPDPGGPFYPEAVYLPDGNLFVNRDCCRGYDEPGQVAPADSNLMQEITTGGSLVRQVAVGIQDNDHGSLSVDPTGNWLLYLSGPAPVSPDAALSGTLYVSRGGATPVVLTSGLAAAAWQ